MPISKENICKKSSQFHFVNDYLYKPLQDEDGNNSTLYADRYYPEGYEPGFDMGEIEAPEKPKLQTYVRRPQNSAEVGNGRRRQPAQRQGSENPRKVHLFPVPMSTRPIITISIECRCKAPTFLRP